MKKSASRIFVGGATGATGRAFVPLGVEAGVEQVVHVRPKSKDRYEGPVPPAVFDLDDAEALDAAMQGCEAVVSMIGTMRKRFGTGDTYAVSDVGTTRLLLESAQRCGVRHFILMGAYGTSWIPGPYYDAKREAEALVMSSGLTWTLVRPSALLRRGERPRGVRLSQRLEVFPELADQMKNAMPIPVEVCARAMVRIARDGLHRNAIVLGRDLWPLGTTGFDDPVHRT